MAIGKEEILSEIRRFVAVNGGKIRFRLKKRQGEWYDPNSEDIEAFKKRREFMFSEFFP